MATAPLADLVGRRRRLQLNILPHSLWRSRLERQPIFFLVNRMRPQPVRQIRYRKTFRFSRAARPIHRAFLPVTSYTGIHGPVTTASISNGQAKFISVGCVACHVQSHTTGNSTMTGQSKLTYTSWSDYALHNMGTGLADGLRQGSAGPQDYKTTALWGIGQRIFFLHDGRTTDLYQAILSHSSSQS